eukprot:2745695-Pleurochrysis_carterae.AAC.1
MTTEGRAYSAGGIAALATTTMHASVANTNASDDDSFSEAGNALARHIDAGIAAMESNNAATIIGNTQFSLFVQQSETKIPAAITIEAPRNAAATGDSKATSTP